MQSAGAAQEFYVTATIWIEPLMASRQAMTVLDIKVPDESMHIASTLPFIIVPNPTRMVSSDLCVIFDQLPVQIHMAP